jgi:glycosyltransferase involved in cell wall biosynthesis
MSSEQPRANPRFILIDHSIADFGGHYYEYAAHVLESASRRGYKPILATNRSFGSARAVPYETYAVYKYGLWFSLSKPKWYRILGGWYRRSREWFIVRKIRLTFSPLGRRVASVRHLVRRALQAHVQATGRSTKSDPQPLVVRAIRHVLRHSRRVRHGAVAAMARACECLKRCARRKAFSALRHAYDVRRYYAFKRSTRRLMRTLRPTEGDIVFCPTILEVEARAVAALLRETPYCRNATWHLLSRRNLLSGRRVDYAAQESTLALFRRAFEPVRQACGDGTMRFYTDTPELSEQHALLGVAEFSTLPIPHTYRPRQGPQTPGGPLRVTYLGDARKEKGYQYLPGVIGDLWNDYAKTGKVQFVVQSNYNTPAGGAEAVVARAQLEALDSGAVEVIYGPLSSDQYANLLLSADVVLIPYDRDNYYARSSGILAEALSAGIPVVVPAGTWMARQFADEVYKHRKSLHLGAQRSVTWKAHGSGLVEPPGGCETTTHRESIRRILPGNVLAACWLEVPEQASILSVRLLPESIRDVESILVVIDELTSDGFAPRKEALLDPGRCTSELYAAVALTAGTRRVRLGLANPHGSQLVLLKELDIGFVVAEGRDARCRPALGAIGVIYTKPHELADAIREIVDHNDHYKASALSFAPAVAREHNSDVLVDKLLGVSHAPHDCTKA